MSQREGKVTTECKSLHPPRKNPHTSQRLPDIPPKIREINRTAGLVTVVH